MNELYTVKAFIQMRGRARQKNSKFYFICSEQQNKQVEFEYNTYKDVIDQMKSIAYSKRGEIQPDEDII